MDGTRQVALRATWVGTTMPGILSGIGSAAYATRDVLELAGKVPRNTAIANVIHLAVGAGAVTALAIAQSKLLPDEAPASGAAAGATSRAGTWDRYRGMKMTDGLIVAAAAATVFLTAGMQLASPGSDLARGITPMYFLAVGAFGAQELIANPMREALEH